MIVSMPVRRSLAAVIAALSILACGDDEPSGPPRVPTSLVAQTPTTISATVGTALPAAPSVVVLAQDGKPLRGSEVRFAIVGGGTVITPIVKTDSRGVASSGVWTLGTGSGSQTLTATVGTVTPLVFTASATPGAPATSVAHLGDAQTATVGTTLALAPTVLVRDQFRNPVPGVPVTFSVRSGGGTATGTLVTTDPNGIATVGSWTLGTTSGVQKLGAAVFGLPDAMYAATSVAGPAQVMRLVAGAEQIAHVGSALSAPVVINVRDRYENPAADRALTVSVAQGGGAVASAIRTDTAGRAIIDGWRVGPAEGLNSIVVSLEGLPPLTVLAKAVPSSSFDITLRYLTAVSTSQHLAFENAARRWRKVIIGDSPDVPLALAASFCGLGEPALNETVDDLLIYVQIVSIDGPGRILGQAGACAIRTAGAPGLIGVMRFDIEDVLALEAAARFEDIILHEVGHVLGMGAAMWSLRQLITGRGGPDPYYTGVNGRSGFAAIGGGGYIGTPVPIEMIGGPGTRDSHWREEILQSELMTGFSEPAGTRMPLSLLTIGALQDLGYQVTAWGDDRYDFGADVQAQLGRGSATMTTARELIEAPLPKPTVALDATGRVVAMPAVPSQISSGIPLSVGARPVQALEVRRRP